MLFNILINLLSKIDKGRLTKCKIGLKFETQIDKYFPDDDEWHFFSVTTSYWVHNNRKCKESPEVVSLTHVHSNGKRVDTIMKMDFSETSISNRLIKE